MLSTESYTFARMNKKSNTAYPENQRMTGFLLGLIVALSLCFTMLELTTRDDGTADDSELLDEFARDLESLPVMEQKDMIAAAPPTPQPTLTEQLVEVKDEPMDDKLEKPAPDVTAEIPDEGLGEHLPEPVTTAISQSPVALDEDDRVLNFRVVEELPEFPGGMVEFMKWLTKNLKYPASAKSRKIQGKVIVQFVVNKDGSITGEKIAKPMDASLDAEALRVVKMMPKWKPGQMVGKPCRTLFAIPIIFKL